MAIYFPGNGNYELLPWVGVSGTVITGIADVRKNAGSGFWTGDPQWVNIKISGADGVQWWTYDFRNQTPKTLRAGSASRDVGYGTFLVEMWVNMDSGIGQAYYSQWVTISNPATVPPPPTMLSLDQVTATSMRVRFGGNGDGGSAITRWEYQVSTTADFSSGATVYNGGGTDIVNNLLSGTRYWVRARGVNAIGTGGWSNVLNAKTLAMIRRGKGGQFVTAQIFRGKGGQFVPAELYRGRGGQFVPAR